jgi:WD40 repeat protein
VLVNPRSIVAAAASLLALSACGETPGADPTPSATSSPAKPTSLELDGLAVGAAPKIGWSRMTALNGDATKKVLPADVDDFAETKQLLVVKDLDGNVFAYSPDGPIGTTPIGKATGTLAVNDERNLVAWIAPDGSPTVLQEGEARPASLLPQAGVTTGDAVAVHGTDCFNGPETVEGAGCSVYFRGQGERPQSFISSNHGFVEPIGDPGTGMQLQDADETGEVGWTTLNEDQTSCSTYRGRETLDADTAKTWRTCDHLPLTFSPDGKHLLATGPHGYEGLGASSLAILDRDTGKPVLTLSNNEKSQAAIIDMVWEDDAHVLAVIVQKWDWGLVRVGLDGTVELADEPIRSDEELARNPYGLAVQP